MLKYLFTGDSLKRPPDETYTDAGRLRQGKGSMGGTRKQQTTGRHDTHSPALSGGAYTDQTRMHWYTEPANNKDIKNEGDGESGDPRRARMLDGAEIVAV